MVRLALEAEFDVGPGEPDVEDADWSPDGRLLAALAATSRVACVFDVATGRRIARVDDLAGGAASIRHTVDARVVIPSRQAPAAAFSLWNHRTGELQAVAGPHAGAQDEGANQLFRFDVGAGRRLLAGLHNGPSDGPIDFPVAVYDLTSAALIAHHSSLATRLALAPDGRRIALAEGGRVRIVGTLDGRAIANPEVFANDVTHLDWSADGRTLAVGTMASGFGPDPTTGRPGPLRDDVVLKLIDGTTGRTAASAPPVVRDGIEALEFSPDGRWLAVVDANGDGWLLESSSLRPVVQIGDKLGPGSVFVRFAPESGRFALVRTFDAIARVLRLT